jgi:hypothetical protein
MANWLDMTPLDRDEMYGDRWRDIAPYHFNPLNMRR